MSAATENYISPREVPGELLKKYQRPGPRYTSYPTAPQFTDLVDFDAIAKRWKAGNESGSGLSLYTHIPFCRSRCTYCGCHTRVRANPESVRTYVEALKTHLDRLLRLVDADRPVEQMALGGGTPTYLQPNQMEDLIRTFQDRLRFPENGERSTEIDPRWVDTDYLDLLVDLGFNRFSFGLQDLHPEVQKRINRVLPFDRIESIMHHLQGRGIEALNLDLIYGLPGQTPASFVGTVSKVISLKPSRIALFGYAHVPWVSPHQKALEKHGLPDTAQRMELFGVAFEHLLEAGYRHVGMDHFALASDELIEALDSRTLTRNFMGYTTRRGLDLVALGASGISSVAGTYAQNVKEIEAYSEASGTRWMRGFWMSDEDRLRRRVIMELFCNFHLDTPVVESEFGVDFQEHFAAELNQLQGFVEDELLVVEPAELQVTELGRFFIRNIAMTFDRYLSEEPTEGRRYSKTL